MEKKRSIGITVIVIFFLLLEFPLFCFAQDCATQQECIDTFRKKYGQNLSMTWNIFFAMPKGIDGPLFKGKIIKDESDAQMFADEFLKENSRLLKINAADLRPLRVNVSKFSYSVVYSQYYRDLRVESAAIKVVISREKDTKSAVRINFFPDISISIKPTMTKEQAIAITKKAYLPSRRGVSIEPEVVDLVIYPKEENIQGEITKFDYFLVWKVTFQETIFFIAAHNGEEIARWKRIVD